LNKVVILVFCTKKIFLSLDKLKDEPL